MNMVKKAGGAAAVVAVMALVMFSGSASGANTVRSADIVNDSIQSIDVKQNTLTGSDIANGSINGGDINTGAITSTQLKDGGVAEQDLSQAVRDKLNPGPADTGFEADGPYPGATDLGDMDGQGDNSDSLVAGDEGAAVQEVWVQCAEGKVALGGGFTLGADAALSARKAIQVLASEPAQVRDGAVVYEPIAGDEAGSFVPNAWRVEVLNNGTSDVVVRPHVTCVKS